MSEQFPLEWHSNYAAIQNRLLSEEKLVANGAIYPRWIEGSDHFWYELRILADFEYRVRSRTWSGDSWPMTNSPLTLAEATNAQTR